MRRKLFARLLTAAAVAASIGAASAQAPRGVVELFTSQGCASCPAADRLLAKLAQDSSLITLSFPVDYWDYLGWKDTLASPAFTARQNAYASARGDGEVYTPQVVIDGVVHAVGSDDAGIASGLAKAGMRPVDLKVSRAQNVLDVAIGASPGPATGNLWLLRVARTRTVPVGRGENAGRKLTYTNVVRSMVRAGDWSGVPKTVRVPVAGGGDGDLYVLLLQAGSAARPGRILAAAQAAE